MGFDYQIFLPGSIPSNVIHGHYNLELVVLSYLVAFLGSYIALDLTGRIFAEPLRRYKVYWLTGCAILMGCSIWSMHFIGMLAYVMPMPMSYDTLWTFLSLCVAIIGSLVAFSFIISESTSIFKMSLCGIFMGSCIASMHYIGMEAMKANQDFKILYIPWIFFLSIGIAIMVSMAAILLLMRSNQDNIHRQFQLKIFSALVMGGAICSMHYTGMAAAVFIPGVKLYDVGYTIYPYTIVYYLAAVMGLMFFISLITSTQRQLIINSMQKNIAYEIQAKLEKKVSQRTAELKNKNNELTTALDKLKNIQNNLVYAEKMSTIGQLSAGIVHEINNPLSYTLSNLSFFQKYYITLARLFDLYNLLLDELNENSLYNKSALYEQVVSFIKEKKIPHIIKDLEAMLAESTDGLLRIKTIVANLNSLSATSTENNPIDVNAIILTSIDIAWNELKYKCHIIKNFADIPTVNGSIKQFELMIVNLLLNAVQSITKQGEITIITSVKNSNICISIIDNGCGIPPENINKLFTPFFTTKPVGSGTGLGLATVYSIVKSYDGDITVKSELGEGSTFTIYLPINKNGA